MGNFALFRYLHEEKFCPLDEMNNNKDNNAHLAASIGSLDFIKYLQEHGVPLDDQNVEK